MKKKRRSFNSLEKINERDWTLEQWRKLMWTYEQRFTELQSDGVRRASGEVMHPSFLTVQACVGGYDVGAASLG